MFLRKICPPQQSYTVFCSQQQSLSSTQFTLFTITVLVNAIITRLVFPTVSWYLSICSHKRYPFFDSCCLPGLFRSTLCSGFYCNVIFAVILLFINEPNPRFMWIRQVQSCCTTSKKFSQIFSFRIVQGRLHLSSA